MFDIHPTSPREIVIHPEVRNIPRDVIHGAGISVLQIETEIFHDHRSVKDKFTRILPLKSGYDRSGFLYCKHAVHGTAVASILKDDRFGIASRVNYKFAGCCDQNDIDDGIANTLHKISHTSLDELDMKSGDIVTVSMQYPVRDRDGKLYYFPIDSNRNMRRSLERLIDKGLIVFIAAGNSNVNLDSQQYVEREIETSYSKNVDGKSRSIKIGYTGIDYKNHDQSNYGSQINFFAPAESIRAACYDYKSRGKKTDLIGNFSLGFCRTSASTPLVSGIAACVQSVHQNLKGTRLDRDQMIGLLSKHATRPIGHEDKVGVFPNLNAILDELVG